MRVSNALGRVLRLAVPALVMAWAPGAWAQYDMPQAPPADDETEEAGRTVPSPAREPGLPGPTPDFERAPRTYTVQEGDTLWDITRRFLGNPWYWPKVWSTNPELVNPNWIQPGHVLRFEGGDLGPTEIAPAEQLAAETPPPPAAEQVVDQTAELSYRPTQPTIVIDEGFVTDEELQVAGRLVAAFEQKTLLTTYDRAYVEFAEGARPEVGERYVIFRTTRRVRHPKTGRPLGWLTEIVGTTRVVEDRGTGVVTVEIGDVLDAAQRGDRLMPYTRPLSRIVNRRENTVELDGAIVATLRPMQVIIGEYHYVFIDKGARDGVQVGNTFEILRRGDPLEGELDLGPDTRLPWEPVGRVLAVDVREEVTTGVVIDSVRELDIGDRAVLRVGGGMALR